MYNQVQEDIFLMFYASVAMLSLIACCYLLFRRANAIGTNRSYLSRYFSCQGTTYNAYINDLRINHFVSLYRETIASKRSFTAQQLALESGFRNYNTFGAAFKKTMGMNTTEWMRLTK